MLRIGFFLGGTLYNVGLFSQLYVFNTFSAVGFHGSNCYQWLELVSSCNWDQCILSIFALCVSTTVFQHSKSSLLETLGVFFGICGVIIMLLGVQRNHSPNIKENDMNNHLPTFYGGAAAFSGAVDVSINLIIGQKLRSFLPIWMYVFPVIRSAAVASLFSVLINRNDPVTWTGYVNTLVFGFLSRDYFLFALYLGVGPGIGGHTLLSTLLKYVSPLVVSTAMLCDQLLVVSLGISSDCSLFRTFIHGLVAVY